MSKAVMQQALEFCEFLWRDVMMNDYSFERLEQNITALRAALVEPETKVWCDCGDSIEPDSGAKCGNCVAGDSAAPEQPVIPDGMVLAPEWKGYALFGTGQYAINHTPAPMNPELGGEIVVTFATDAEKSGDRKIGEARDNDPNDPPIQPQQIVIRMGFLCSEAIDALEDQLIDLRREHFPSTRPLAVSKLIGRPPLQAGMSSEELEEAFMRKLPGVKLEDRLLSAFAVGTEVGYERRTAPTPRKPVELTDWDIDRVTDQQWAQHNHKPIYAAHRAYARAVIAAYERKNGITGEKT